jgi:hypothetical protein
MDRYGIILGKTPPTSPKKKKVKKEAVQPEVKTEILSNSTRMEFLSNLLRTAEGRGRLAASMTHPILLRTAEGRGRLAASMTHPIRQGRDYRSLAHRIFRVDSLPPGANPVYDLGDEESYSMDDEGLQVIPISRTGRRGSIPLFEIALNPQIPLSAIREQRFGLVDNVQMLTIRELVTLEDTPAFSLLERVTSNNVLNEELSRGSLMDIFSSIESNDLRVANLFVSPSEYTDMRRYIGRDAFDVGTHTELRNAGIMGTLFGAQLNVSRVIPPGVIYATAEPQYVGVIPQRMDVTVLSADDPEQLTIGFSIFEQLGMACFNTRGVGAVARSIVESIVESEEPVFIMPRLDRYALLRQGHE